MSGEIQDLIDIAVRLKAQERALMIEKCCEAALAGGVCGVLITDFADGHSTAEVNPKVPYGQIYVAAPDRSWAF